MLAALRRRWVAVESVSGHFRFPKKAAASVGLNPVDANSNTSCLHGI
jgi:hypothetical protein